MIRVGIIGGAGYTAGELLRVLINHPGVELVFAHSNSNAGKPVTSVHGGLYGECDLVFTGELTFDKIDVLFMCSAHGDSKKFLESHSLPPKLKIIDLSTDYRDESDGFVYGLPELQKEKIRRADKVANPGCFATCIELALLPLAAAGLLTSDIHVNAITGSTGAGVKPSSTSHFSWRNNNISVYKAFEHQHLKEIRQSLSALQKGFKAGIHFIPLRGNFSRGILATAYTTCPWSLEEAIKAYTKFYREARFCFVCEENPDLKQVVNTNKCLLYLEKHGDQLLIISVVDNLLKGASGQAVQNMNLMFGLDERAGLNLKSTGF